MIIPGCMTAISDLGLQVNMLKILCTAMAQLPGSKIVKTGVELGICSVELMFTMKSILSLNGGQARVGKVEFAATNPTKKNLLNSFH